MPLHLIPEWFVEEHQQEWSTRKLEVLQVVKQNLGKGRELNARAILKKTELEQMGSHLFAKVTNRCLVRSQPKEQKEQQAHWDG